ncbi:UDP-N-acetylglucosamine 2-epimerase homolog [Brevibacillus sp. IT-7CA2]|uniref:non-hydrolyzing UDP-N-acetylglucosamine 2-epimerase n=1 Tax=Brevibacillus sp. IT-7CA2 TaxID=3026436 RepID=UPI0039E1015B
MKIVTIVGARPQFIKAAAVSRAVLTQKQNNPQISEVIVHTGQHYDRNMSEVFFEQLDIPVPHYHLGIGSSAHGQQTGQMLAEIEKVLLEEKPDWILVYGDTNSTLAGALAASKLHIPVAHVEAGLRSYNRHMPEEVNRVLTDHVSNLLFCPTSHSVDNLHKEGINEGVHVVGDVMYDCMKHYLAKLDNERTTILESYGLEANQFALATVHRAENTNDRGRLTGIFEAFGTIAQDIPVLVSLHPRTRKYLDEYGIKVNPNILLIEPVSYLEMIELESNAAIILTDSGGVQKEAYFVQRPCITMRDETEWVETVNAGANVLTGAHSNSIVEAYNRYKEAAFTINEVPKVYGDGDAAEQIIRLLVGGA